MSAFELLVEFSLVTHASDSPHMHVVLQYLLLLLVNPKLCLCLFVCFIFSYPPDRILVVARNVRYPPRTTSWSPAGVRSDMVRRKLTCVGARGRNVTLNNLQRLICHKTQTNNLITSLSQLVTSAWPMWHMNLNVHKENASLIK